MEAGQSISRVEQEVVVVVGIFMYTTTAIRLTTDGFRTRRISLVVWRLIPGGDSLMGMGGTRIRGHIGLLLGKGGKDYLVSFRLLW